jgi:D-alanyl-D-alanine dipeptidase
MIRMPQARALAAVLLTLPAASLAAQDSVPARTEYAATAALLTRFIEHEMSDKDLPAVSIALVDDTTIVWARGFGNARDSAPATAATIYRVGGVSSFLQQGAFASERAAGTMWAPDGRRFAAPAVLHNGPSGGSDASVTDLGHALARLFGDSSLGPSGPALDGHRRIRRNAAIPGFATTLAALPDDRFGVVVVTTLDGATTITERVAEAALRAMLAARAGTPLPAPALTSPLAAGVARAAAGHYARRSGSVDLLERAGDLFVSRDGSAVPARVRALGDSLVFDDPLVFGGSVRLHPDAVIVDSDSFPRAPEPVPAPPPARWVGLLGEYGWSDETLFVFERGGRLHALIGWIEDDVLTQVSDTAFAVPTSHRHAGKQIVFHGTRTGRASDARLGAVTYPRRAIGPQSGGQLKVTPVHPVAELLAAARTATPPAESGSFRPPELVDLATLDSTIRFDIRYATTNNFLGSVFYSTPHAFLQRPAAEALLRAQRRLRPMGYGLLIHDGYRPWYVTKTFWDATPPALRWLVANPANGSRHNRGCAVDLTLYDLRTGRPIDMGGTYDETTERSYPDYPVTTGLQRWRRDVLRQAMEAEGFTRISNEWWHFDYRDWRSYPILNVPFEQL